MSDKLKPCPFCGGEAIHIGGGGQHGIMCTKCKVTNERLHGYFYDAYPTYAKAAEAWNHRATPTTHAVIVSDASTDGATGWCKCERCGESINPWANYCSNCGAEVER